MISAVRGMGLASLLLTLMATAGAGVGEIDGTWCSPHGEVMSVTGPQIITPSGNEVTGRYGGDRVDYQIPKGERHAGGRIWAEQITDQRIRVTLIKIDQRGPGDHDDWLRCDPVS